MRDVGNSAPVLARYPAAESDISRLLAEIERWTTGTPHPTDGGLELAQQITELVRHIGRHQLGAPLLNRLVEIRDRHRRKSPFLGAFLDAILARHEDRFRNQTYLALPLLALILADRDSHLDADRLSALVIADIVRHESEPDSAGRTDPDTRRKRIQHARRFVAAVDAADVTALPEPPETTAAEWLSTTALPTSLVHDEYFFLRVLQARELVFTALTGHIRRATEELRDGYLEKATEAVTKASSVFVRAAMLFRIVATVRAEHFREFRVYTDGASAIQSEAYKRFEVSRGEPAAARLASDAFTNLPPVQAEAPERDSLARAYADLRRAGRSEDQATRRLSAAMAELEASHQRWQTTHHRLAARTLGEAPGSGTPPASPTRGGAWTTGCP